MMECLFVCAMRGGTLILGVQIDGTCVVLDLTGLQLLRSRGIGRGSSGTESRGRTTRDCIKPLDSGIRPKTGPTINQDDLISGPSTVHPESDWNIFQSCCDADDQLRNEQTAESYGSMSLYRLVISFSSRLGIT
jgi:hypothetical protein